MGFSKCSSDLGHSKQLLRRNTKNKKIISGPRWLLNGKPTVLRSRQSAPMMSHEPTYYHGSSNKNEEWAELNITKLECRKLGGDSLKSCMKKCAGKNHNKSKENVKFSKLSTLICYDISISDNTAWYGPADIIQFTKDALARAENVRRLMKYASTNERCYNSAMGFTSPRVLKEYLSNPEEIIGIENLLAGQGASRSSLKRFHTKALAEEQLLQKLGARDPDLLAERLRNNSTISAYLARERAAYTFWIR